jgi:hypothetical protein
MKSGIQLFNVRSSEVKYKIFILGENGVVFHHLIILKTDSTWKNDIKIEPRLLPTISFSRSINNPARAGLSTASFIGRNGTKLGPRLLPMIPFPVD